MNVDAIFGALGRFSVRFRWSVLLAWVVGAVAAAALLPSLSSVTQNDNTKFLPAGAPFEKAAKLATPFGTSNLIPVPLVASRQTGPLTAADTTALAALHRKLIADPAVVRVIDLGQSSAGQTSRVGQANEFVVLVHQLGGNPSAASTLIDDLRAKIRQTPRPAGLRVHLAGSIAVQVDQQKANANQGGQIEKYSALLIILILVLIFRSLTLALVTLAPAFLSVVISGPLLMTRIREEARKLQLRDAVSRALGVTGTTVTSAGLVLAGSFLVLAIVSRGSGSSQIRDIGLALALGILMDTFLVRTLLVPSTVVLLGRWNWWPSTLTVDEPDIPAGEPGALTGQADHVR